MRDRNGVALASSTFGDGTVTSHVGEKMTCVLGFVIDVPGGRGPYMFEIGNFVWAPITEQHMLAGWTFTVGKR